MILAAILGTFLHFPLLALVPMLVILIRKAWHEDKVVNSFILYAISIALLVILLADIVYIRDPFENRMNTVFKFYYQAWIILGIMSAFSLSIFIGTIRKNEYGKLLALIVIFILFVGACVYPVATFDSGHAWVQPAWTLDGLAYLSDNYPDEAAAIEWISANTAPEDVILTSAGSSYDDESGRIAAVTGRPTVLGWSGSHEHLWRSGSVDMVKAVSERDNDVPYMYQTTNTQETTRLLEQYNVDYVYVGPRERRFIAEGA